MPEVETALPQRISWRQHFAWLEQTWEVGMHVSIVTKTNGGKSFLVRYGLLPIWLDYRSLVFDAKNDRKDTLYGLGKEVHSYPADETEEGGPDTPDWRIYRLIVPPFEFDPTKRDTEGLKKARLVAGRALDRAYHVGGWLVVLDETRPFVDPQTAYGLGLRGVVENVWQRGRTREVTLVACTQEPTWMPSSFYSQPALIYIGAEVDVENEHVKYLGNGAREMLRAVVPSLEQNEFLCIYRGTPRQMWRVKVGA
jgi:hypothetical protein